MEALSEHLLSQVHPTLADAIRRIQVPIQVIQGWRSPELQQHLWEQGRTRPGAIVTNAPALHSWHEYKLAVDCCPITLLHVQNWGPGSPLWLSMGTQGEALGLTWGGRWVHPHDPPHFQLGNLPVSPTDAVREAYARGGIPEVWKFLGI